MTLVLKNATLVLPGQVMHGSILVQDGLIAEIQPGAASGTDMDGDTLIAGVVDLHTDNLERQVEPRRSARWPSRAALLAHDSQCAAAGITTVFDALCAGQAGLADDRPRTCIEGVADLAALAPTGLLKADHYLHLRCELPAENLLAQLDTYLDNPILRMASLMDHTPGAGQFNDLPRYCAMLQRDGLSDDDIALLIGDMRARQQRWREPNLAGVLARVAGRPITLASHDDSTPEDLARNLACGIKVSEFPVSLQAAQGAHAAGMAVIGGAPNLVRGGSHSGNVAVAELLAHGLLDCLASDYVPASLVHAAFLAAAHAGMGLPKAVALVTSAPARLAGLPDRGQIAVGLRADLVRVRVHDGVPIVRQVWRAGERVI